MSSEFAYPIFQISTGERGRAENKHPVRNEEFIQLRLGREFEGEEKVFPGHETTTSQRVYSNEGKRGRIIAIAIYRESRCGNIARGDAVYRKAVRWKERGEEESMTFYFVMHRETRIRNVGTREKNRRRSSYRSLSSDKRVAIETHYFSFPQSLLFSRRTSFSARI